MRLICTATFQARQGRGARGGLCLLLLMALFPALVGAGIPGDVSLDGTRTLFDAQLIREYLQGRRSFDGEALLAVDANLDGTVDAADCVYVRAHLSKPVLSSNVVAVGGTTDIAIVAIDEDTVTLLPGGTPPAALAPGAILIGSGEDVLLRRVTQLDVEGANLVAHTESATLNQAVQSGQFSTQLSPSDLAALSSPDSARASILPDGRIRWNVAGLVLARYGSQFTLTVPEGTVLFTPNVAIEAAFENGGWKYLRATAAGDLESSLTTRADSTGYASMIIADTLSLPLPPVSPPPVRIGSMPIDIQFLPSLGTASEVEMVPGILEGRSTLSASLEFGEEYLDGTWRPIKSAVVRTLEGTLEQWTVGESVSLATSLKPLMMWKFFGAEGPTMSSGTFHRFTGTVETSPARCEQRFEGGVMTGISYVADPFEQIPIQDQYYDESFLEREFANRECESTGRIAIDATPDDGAWTLTGPVGFAPVSGQGDRINANALAGLTPGNYTLTPQDNVTGLQPPPPETKTLVAGGRIDFAPVWTASPVEDVTITITGPDHSDLQGWNLIVDNALIGGVSAGTHTGTWTIPLNSARVHKMEVIGTGYTGASGTGWYDIDLTPNATLLDGPPLFGYSLDWERRFVWYFVLSGYDKPLVSIVHEPPQNWLEGIPIPLEAWVDSATTVTSVHVLYSADGSVNFVTLPMTRTPKGSYAATIPGDASHSGTIVYYLLATDGVNTGASPQPAPASFHTIQMTHPGDNSLGFLYTAANHPAPVSSIDLYRQDTGEAVPSPQTIVFNGGVVFQNLAPGVYMADCGSAVSYPALARRLFDLTVTPGSRQSFTLDTPPPSLLSVHSNSLEDTEVRIFDQPTARSMGSADSDSYGVAWFPRLSPGMRYLQVIQENDGPSTEDLPDTFAFDIAIPEIAQQSRSIVVPWHGALDLAIEDGSGPLAAGEASYTMEPFVAGAVIGSKQPIHIANIPPGNYTVQVTNRKSQPNQAKTLYGVAIPLTGGSVEKSVVFDQPLGSLRLTVQLNGVAVGKDQASVMVRTQGNGAGYNDPFLTDEDGEVLVENLVPGTHFAEVRCPPGGDSVIRYFFNLTVSGNSVSVHTLNVQSATTPTGAGRVQIAVTVGHVPVAGQQDTNINLLNQATGEMLPKSANWSLGVAEYANLAAGTYLAWVYGPSGYRFVRDIAVPEGGLAQGAVDYPIGSVAVALTVGGQPVPLSLYSDFQPVLVNESTGEGPGWERDFQDGKAVFNNLPPDTYRLVVYVDYHADNTGYGTGRYWSDSPITVNPYEQSTVGMDLALGDFVLDVQANGQTVGFGEAELSLYNLDTGLRLDTRRNNISPEIHTIQFLHIPAGRYKAVASYNSILDPAKRQTVLDDVVIAPGSTETRTLNYSVGTLEVALTDGGTPVSDTGAVVRLYGEDGVFIGEVTSLTGGATELLSLPPGIYTVEAHHTVPVPDKVVVRHGVTVTHDQTTQVDIDF